MINRRQRDDPGEKLAIVTLRMDPAEHRLLKETASLRRTSLNAWCMGVLLEVARIESAELKRQEAIQKAASPGGESDGEG